MRAPWQSLYFVSAGAVLCAFAVALGAFATHVFGQMFTAIELMTFEKGVLYQFVHGLGLIISGVLCKLVRRKSACVWAGAAFLVGIVFFSFSLYCIVLFDWKFLGAVAPIGGLSFMLGWLLIVWAAHGGWE